jgi:hypothetical protein
LDGSDPIDPTEWASADEGDEADWLETLLMLTVGAAQGDSDAMVAIDPILDEYAGDPDSARVAESLRAIVGGDRDPVTLTDGLDEEEQRFVAAVLDVLASGAGSPGDTNGSGIPERGGDTDTGRDAEHHRT